MSLDRYAVIGNPVAHSRSPLIHSLFARQTHQAISYEALLAPLNGFQATVAAFRARGGRGANVTVPFKLEAHALADCLSPRAAAAGAANTLRFDDGGIFADNTDGAGLLRDLVDNLGCRLEGTAILLLGAGGAARGVMLPLLDAAPASLTIVNRSEPRALELAQSFQRHAGKTTLDACGFAALSGHRYDLVINATSASLSGEAPPLPAGLYGPGALAYDMMYGRNETAFLAAARRAGAKRLSDGLGMLVEQAAESFLIWRGVRPQTRSVIENLRGALRSPAEP